MRHERGFTLLEIIIAITLIAFFVTLPILAYSGYLKKTRDTQRKNSINQIQSALEQYRANNGKYPPTDTWKDVLVSQGYLPSIPKDPMDGTPVSGETGVYYGFDYQSSADGQSYQLTARLEENQPGGKGYSNEKSYYTVGPEGPKIVYITPGGNLGGGSGSGTINAGNLTGTFSGTGNGTVTGGTITFTGTVTNGIFTGTYTGTVTGSGITGTITGNYTGPVSGNLSGSVSGTATITGGTVSGTNFTGTFGSATLTPSTSGGLPSNTPIPTTSGIPTYTPTNTPTNTPTRTPTPTFTITPSPTLTPTNTPTSTPTLAPALTPAPTYTLTPTPTQIRFSQTIGGASDDRGYHILQTADGGYVVLGSTNSFGAGGYDIYLTKYTSLGVISWTKTIGTAAGDNAAGIFNTSDGGFLIAGSTDSGQTQYNYAGLLIKTDASGNITWKTTLPAYSGLTSAAQVSPSVYVAAGKDSAGGILATFNATTGALQTYDKYSGFSNGFTKVVVDINGGYAVFGGWNYYMVRLDSARNVAWARQLNGGTNDFLSEGIQDASGNYVMAGPNGASGVDGSRDMFVAKVDQTGNLLWSKRYNYGAGLQEGANSIKQTSDGGYIVVGYSDMTLANMSILKIDTNGGVLWARQFGNSNANDTAQDVVQTSDGGFGIIGYTDGYSSGNQLQLVKLDQYGNYPGTCTEMANATMTGTALGGIAALSSTHTTGAGSSTVTLSVGTGGTQSNICF